MSATAHSITDQCESLEGLAAALKLATELRDDLGPEASKLVDQDGDLRDLGQHWKAE